MTTRHLWPQLGTGRRHLLEGHLLALKKRYNFFYICIGKKYLISDDWTLWWIQVQKLVEMGFPEDLVRSTLESVNGDENQALEMLCSS